VVGGFQREVGVEPAGLHVFGEVVVERDHPVALAGEDGVTDRDQVVGPDRTGHRQIVEHHLQGEHPFVTGHRAGQQVLAEHRAQVEGELGADLICAAAGEEVGEPADRALGVAGVHGGKHQVAGLGGGKGHLGGFLIADFADQNHIRVLPQTVLQTGCEAGHVHAHLALGDQRVVAERMDVFDGFLDGDYAATPLANQVFEEDGQRRALAGTSHPGGQDQPVVKTQAATDDMRGQPGPFHAGHPGRNHPHASAQRSAGVKHIEAKAMPLVIEQRLVGEIQIVDQVVAHPPSGLVDVLVNHLRGGGWADRAQHRRQRAPRDRIAVGRELPVNAQAGGVPGQQVQIGGLRAYGVGEQGVHGVQCG
jgi:hypothetical protein